MAKGERVHDPSAARGGAVRELGREGGREARGVVIPSLTKTVHSAGGGVGRGGCKRPKK